jgi:hypothetical protein
LGFEAKALMQSLATSPPFQASGSEMLQVAKNVFHRVKYNCILNFSLFGLTYEAARHFAGFSRNEVLTFSSDFRGIPVQQECLSFFQHPIIIKA